MARIRTIKPEFWVSEQVVACSPMARLLFIGIWNFCDDGGRMPYSPQNLKMKIFPGDDITSENVRGMIGELSGNDRGTPLVLLYHIDGQQYLQVTGWDKHQRIERPNYQFPDKTGKIPQSTGFRNPRVGERSTPERKGKDLRNGREGKGKEEEKNKNAGAFFSSRPVSDDWPADYRQQFADAYPHKVHMAAGLRALEKARGTVSWCVVLSGLESYASKQDDRPWLNPKTFVEQERWNDKPGRPVGNGRHKSTIADCAADYVRELEAIERAQAVDGSASEVGGSEVGGDHARVVSGEDFG